MVKGNQMTKLDTVRKILKKDKHITHLKAQHYAIGCVRKAISLLRAEGMNIITQRKKDAQGAPYTSWKLV